MKFLHGGCSLIVGTVKDDGQPVVSRGWGLTVVDTDPLSLRLLVHEDLVRPGAIAVTACDVRTLRSMQLKGRVVAIEPLTDTDHAKRRQYTDEFFSDIAAADAFPRELLDRLVPDVYLACTIGVDEMFDQTPGPRAGAPLA